MPEGMRTLGDFSRFAHVRLAEPPGVRVPELPAATVRRASADEPPTSAAIEAYLRMLREPEPEPPRREDHRPSKLARYLAPGLSVLAQGFGGVSPAQAETMLGEVMEGPYRRAMADYGVRQGQRGQRMRTRGDVAKLEMEQQRTRADVDRERRMAGSAEASQGRPMAVSGGVYHPGERKFDMAPVAPKTKPERTPEEAAKYWTDQATRLLRAVPSEKAHASRKKYLEKRGAPADLLAGFEWTPPKRRTIQWPRPGSRAAERQQKRAAAVPPSR